MALGERTLRSGLIGYDIIELQIRLAGFRGTIWDGDFGPGTELQVMTFQRDYMGEENPDGVVGQHTFTALCRFADEYPVDFDKLMCQCGECDGFGNGLYKDEYREDYPRLERYYKYEYPGIHKAILHTYRSAQFYAKKEGFPAPIVTCGYRCWVNNRKKNRSSTNHMGKAIDIDLPLQSGDDKRDDCSRCDDFRERLVELSNFHVGWHANNRKSLEPSNIAPSWIHMDVSNYSRKHLDDKYFVKSPEDKL